MRPEEQTLLTNLNRLADCLQPHDRLWPGILRQAAAEADELFRRDADVSSKFEFLSRHNYSAGGMGSLNDGIVPEACEPPQRELYKAINDLLRLYWKELGREWHEYSEFDLFPEGTKVRLKPGKIIFCNSVYSSEVSDTADAASKTWVVIGCDGPDITNMPSYTIRHANTFRSARHEALEIVGGKKSLLERVFG